MNYKNNYIVQFMYYTDVRAEAKVSAYNEMFALAKAFEEIDYEDWVNDKGFKIVIEMEE